MKKILAVLFILILGLTALPAAAQQAEGFDLRLLAEASGEGWSWDREALTLTLDGAELKSENEAVFQLPDGATVMVQSDSRLEATKSETPANATFYALSCEGALTLAGEGTLAVESAGGGVLATNLTVNCKLQLRAAVYGLHSTGDLSIQAPLQCVFGGDAEKIEETIAIYAQGALTADADVSVNATDAACAIKGKTVVIRQNAQVDVSNENDLPTDDLAAAGVYSVNAVAGAEGITLTGNPTVNASVESVGVAECVMAGQSYESSSSVGDFVMEGGSLTVSARCTETAAFGVGGIHVALNGGALTAKVSGTDRADRISAAVVAGRYGGVSVADGVQIATPKGGYISSDGRTIVNAGGETAAEVSVSGGNGGVFQDTVSSNAELICLIVCAVVLAAIVVLMILRIKRERT